MNRVSVFNTLTTTITKSADQVSTFLQGETIILHVKSGKYYNLNPVGTRIWELIDQPITVQAVIETIETEYNVEHERCESDVLAIVHAMQAAGLVQLSESLSEAV